jgi:hypothetical protein
MINAARPWRRLRPLPGIVAALLLMSVTQRAEALSPISPGSSPAVTIASDTLVPVHGGHGGGGHMGGGGGHWGGGHMGGGGVFHGGGAFHGGWHGGGVHIGAPIFHHHFVRRFYGYAPGYYADYYAEPYGYCPLVWTPYGPHRICHYRPWHHHWHHWHHYRRHHHWRHYY